MPLFLITGSAGTGKSTVCNILRTKGYTAYDVDIDGLARWRNIKTGYVYPKSSIKISDRTPEFLAENKWCVATEVIVKLKDKSANSSTFICGNLYNEDEVWTLFNVVFELYVDNDILRHRLSKRSGNDWGAKEYEVRLTLEKHNVMHQQYISKGAVIIDALQKPDKVTEDILSKVQSPNQR